MTRRLPVILTTTPDGLTHYRCPTCRWTWGSEHPPEKTACPMEPHHSVIRVRRPKRRPVLPRFMGGPDR
jgi:hypothetical protein